MSKTTDPLTARQQRQLAYVSETTTDILHVAGKYNVVADCLSRAGVNDISLGIDFLQIAKVRTDNDDIQAYRTANTRLVLADIAIYDKGGTRGPRLAPSVKGEHSRLREGRHWRPPTHAVCERRT